MYWKDGTSESGKQIYKYFTLDVDMRNMLLEFVIMSIEVDSEAEFLEHYEYSRKYLWKPILKPFIKDSKNTLKSIWNNMGIFSVVIGAVSSFVSNFFGWKQAQADVVQKAIEVLNSGIASDSDKAKAASAIIVAEASSSGWLARNWRPMFMVIFMIIIMSYWFGYSPPNLNAPMPPMVDRLFGLIELGMGGYIGGRTLEKIISNINLAGVIKALINKKL